MVTLSDQHSCVLPASAVQGVVSASVRETDVAIVGGGLSGSLAAAVLGRAGHRVVLVDRNAVYPSDFRVEKIGGGQVDALRRLGLIDCIAAASTPFDRVVNVRHGRVLDRSYGQHHGFMYQDLVKAVRAELPASVPFVIDQVMDLEAGPERQRLALAGGGAIDARLVVLATGMGVGLRAKLGIERRVVSEKHSLSFAFTLVPGADGRLGGSALTYYGEQVEDCIDYLSLFPVGDLMRANLFTFRDHRDAWARDLRRDPKAALYAVMPGLRPFLGDFRVLDKVQNWLMDLHVVENHRRDGVVLIGDAFQTSCPAAGTGVSRLLTDVERLCTVYLPRWLVTPGMDAAKIAQFYDDPAKQASDASSAHLAHYRRSLTVDRSLPWQIRRRQHFLRRRLLGWTKDFESVRALRRTLGGG